MKKKCIIIIAVVCVAVVAVAGTVFGVRAYNDYTLQQQTEERIKSIDDTYADFLDETDRSKKLEKLSDFIKNKPSTNDEIAVEVLNAVEPKYSETLEKMQKYFTDDYDYLYWSKDFRLCFVGMSQSLIERLNDNGFIFLTSG